MNTRPPSNKPILDKLKNDGYRIKIEHFRRVPVRPLNPDATAWSKQVIPDREWREFLFTNNYDLPDENGGATELTLERGEEKIVVRADCYYKDRFCRRVGVREALKKLESLYGIKP